MQFPEILNRIFERKLTVVLLFAAFLITGLLIFKDYGVSWDEEVTRTQNGLTNYNFIFHHDKEPLLHSEERYHGPVFEIVLFTLERVFHLTEIRTIHLFRHLITFLLFFVSSIFMFFLARNVFKKQLLALLAVLIYVLSPRIFGESFYNTKDLAFLSLFTISLYTLERFIGNKKFKNTLLHAFACGLMIDIRITGVIIPLITAVVFFIDYLAAKPDEATTMLGFRGRLGISITQNGTDFRPFMISPLALFLASAVAFLLLQFVFIVLFWPLLWIQPLHQFVLAFKQMSSYPWLGDVLYLGRLVHSTKLPWHYAPVWMLVTIPTLYTVFFLAGVFSFFSRNMPSTSASNKFLRIASVIFLLPIVSVILFHSILYDGWRHLYFIYAPFVLIATRGAEHIYNLWVERGANAGLAYRKLFFASIIGLSFILTTITILDDHPNEQTFFNYPTRNLLPPNLNFETDYWGLSYRQAFEEILKTDTAAKVHVRILLGGQLNAQILNPKDRERIVFHSDEREANYNLLLFLGRGGRDGRYPIATSEYPVLKEIRNTAGELLAVCQGKRSRLQEESVTVLDDSIGIKNLTLTQFSRSINSVVDSVGKNEIEEATIECQLSSTKPNPNVMLVFNVNREDTNCIKQMVYWEGESFQSTMMKRYIWRKVQWNVNIPRYAQQGDTASTYVWSPAADPVLVKDFKMTITKYSSH